MASEIPFWRTSPLVWDQLKIDGTVVPGIVKVTVKNGQQLDTRKGPKQNNAVLVDQGEPLIEGEIEITFGFDSVAGQPFGTGAEQWTAYQKLKQTIFGRKPNKRNASTVSHPEFTLANVSQAWFGKPGNLEGDGPGVRKVKIPWWNRAKITSAEAGTVGSATGKAKGDTSIASLAKAKKPSATEVRP